MRIEPEPTPWHVVIPVKHAHLAKSRLAPPPPLSRPELARAVARDTLEAVCRAVPPDQVTVVTSDLDAAGAAAGLGAAVVPDPDEGLDAAVRAGLAASAGPWFAVLLGDLPTLTPAELNAALDACAAYPSAVVPDAQGSGTVLLTSTQGHPEPRFGAGSAARHASTATLLPLDLPRLRRDVDTWADLGEALALGLGPATRAALAHLE
ncbi:2-phospho-L-lactate guanylyltransferase [Ornithinimicrobium tianjinense]|uniref:Phosphoenolpyruvate guanylyltransferase n=1 Tax=Ornithinimicrobium tianjinense TaxID=1195761 RepID=A0A917F676_9MICO|nr:2-phospho-L-lactate guanylyltransferase [Ornithinimicrobium tianjinense]GGF50558.1 2-phospho-L-lactate guanylyltransferase [Ornithinimicrobium tianjinense]